jgi:hypothetical protein
VVCRLGSSQSWAWITCAPMSVHPVSVHPAPGVPIHTGA